MEPIARRKLMQGGAALAVAAAVQLAAKAAQSKDAEIIRLANARLAELPEYMRLRGIKEKWPVWVEERDKIRDSHGYRIDLEHRAIERSEYWNAANVWGDAGEAIEKRLRAMTKIQATTI